MLRKLIIFLATVVVLAATHARALGLGDITLESALNQPLSARIELLQTAGVRMEDIRVQMASARDFERFSLDRPYHLDSIRFNVREAGPGDERPYIELSSTSPIREPYLSFVLDTRWSSGRVLAEYTVLLDPPSFANDGVVQAPQPPAATRFEAPQQPAEEPSAAGQEAPENTSEPSPAPDRQSELSASSAEAADVSGASAVNSGSSDTPAAEQRFADTARTVEIDGDDTLWDVALQVRPDDSVSVQQTMLALQRLNPEAFINGNINLVRRGAVLRVPDADGVREMSNAEAISEVGRQNRMFEDRRDAPLGSEPLAAPPAEDDGGASGDGELSVVSVDEESREEADTANADAAAGERLQELDDRIESLEDELAVSREEVDRVERENEELGDRLSMLEEQIESAREIIRLRDMELAQLQESLASDNDSGESRDAGDDQQEGASPSPTVIMASDAPLPQRIMNMVLANPMVLGAILALVVALLVLLLIRRNKAKQAELADEQHGQDDEDELDFSGVGTAAASDAGDDGDRDDDPDDDDDTEAREGGYRGSRQPFEEYEDDDELVDELRSFNEQGEQALVSEELDDLLAEVDALSRQEQHEGARKLLEDAIVADPNRQELRVRLLEVLVAQKDLETFRLQESELGTVKNIALQHRVQTLREQVAALESGDDVEAEALQEHDDTGTPAEERTGGEDEDFDFDLDLDLDDEEPESDSGQPGREEPSHSRAEAGQPTDDTDADTGSDEAPEEAERESSPEAPSEEESAADEDFEFDFDLDLEPEPETKAESGSEREELNLADEEPEPAPERGESDEPQNDAGTEDADRQEDEDFEFSLDDFALDAETDTAETGGAEDRSVTEREAASGDEQTDPFADLSFSDSDAEEQADESEDEFEFLSDTDEAATKLDLARAYIDMGDMEGAREILDEVIEEGTEAQANDARQLIDRLD
ncbi:MAG: FimV/HubP family polar landmark protein [Pseudohongiellaceae bacterium]